MTDSSGDEFADLDEVEMATEDSTPVLYHLADSCGPDELVEGDVYAGTVNGVVDYGVFVSLNDSISGLVHESNLAEDLDVGDEVKVQLEDIRDNGDLNLIPVHMHDYEEVRIESEADLVAVEELEDRVDDVVRVEGRITQAKQTSGPTVFTVTDATAAVDAAAFEQAGVRAYPGIETGDVVRLTGEVEERDGGLQVEVSEMASLTGDEEATVEDRIEAALDDRAAPPDVDPLVDADALDRLWGGLRDVAGALRRAVLTERPIIVRHHADADGISGAAVVEKAVVALIDEHSDDPDAAHHLFRRMPSKAPFYEMEDVTRDLNYALQDVERHGHSTPLLLMVDNGSTAEDVPAYELARTYDVPIYIVDHHSPDNDAVEGLVERHVNPYNVGSDYGVTCGMLCTELARLVHPDVEADVRHVPAVSAKGDRSEADVVEEYAAIAAEEGYDDEHCRATADALDYQAHWLKYDDGKHLVEHVLDIAENDVHDELVAKLKERADEDFETQMDAIGPHVEVEELENGVELHSIDLELYAHKFTFPAPGKTTGRLHDVTRDETEAPVVTIGYGPDFCVIRAHDVDIDIPDIVDELKRDVEGAGVDGGGHKVVGSVKFVEGMRDEVLVELIDRIEAAPLSDEYESRDD